MYDSRYPMVFPLDGRPIPGLQFDALRRANEIGKSVSDRLFGTRAFYNAASGKIFWCYGTEPAGGPVGIDFRRKDGTFVRYEAHQIDDIVSYANYGKASRRDKDRIAEQNAATEAHDKAENSGRFLEGNRKNAEDYAAFLSRKRRGTGTLVSV